MLTLQRGIFVIFAEGKLHRNKFSFTSFKTDTLYLLVRTACTDDESRTRHKSQNLGGATSFSESSFCDIPLHIEYFSINETY